MSDLPRVFIVITAEALPAFKAAASPFDVTTGKRWLLSAIFDNGPLVALSGPDDGTVTHYATSWAIPPDIGAQIRASGMVEQLGLLVLNDPAVTGTAKHAGDFDAAMADLGLKRYRPTLAI